MAVLSGNERMFISQGDGRDSDREMAIATEAGRLDAAVPNESLACQPGTRSARDWIQGRSCAGTFPASTVAILAATAAIVFWYSPRGLNSTRSPVSSQTTLCPGAR